MILTILQYMREDQNWSKFSTVKWKCI